MKDSSKKTDVEEEMEKEIEENPEELPIEEEEAMEAEEELEETEEKAEERTTEEEVSEETIEEEIVEEEEKPERRERKEVEEEIVEERIYTVPLGRAWISPPKKRAPRAIRIIRGFIIKHMKIKIDAVEEEAERLVISNEVNEKIWTSGIKNPPRKIRVRAVKNKEGTVTLHLAEGD